MTNPSGNSQKEGLAYGFKINMSSGPDKGGRNNPDTTVMFSSCEGIQSEIEVQFLNDGAALERAIPVRGRKLGGIVTFSRGVAATGSAANEFFKWYQQVCDTTKPLSKRILNVMLTDPAQADKVLARWEIKGAWPCRWMGPFLETQSTTPTVERISFAYESIQKV